jgi:hypothetical protein
MSIAAGLSATKAGLDVAKLLMDKLAGPDVHFEEVRAKLQELLIHVVNAQVALGEAQVEISDLRARLDTRQEVQTLEEDMDFRIDGSFFIKKSEAGKGLIGYCPLCWKDNLKAIPMRASSDPGWFRCDIHHVTYETAEYSKRRQGGFSRANADLSRGGRGWMR